MVIAISGRKFRIVRDEEDWLTISEKKNQNTEKHYSDTYDLVSRYKIDGNPLKNYIDAIIGLPANIFYGTSIPTCILVMKKCRKEDDNILFIDASKEFEKVKTQNKLRQEHIDKIVSTYRERMEIEKYSHCATLQEIKDNDYNLNIPRYVDTFEEEEEIDIKAVMSEIKELEAKRAELDAQIDVYLKELGII